jgi:hypothetical protein
VITAPERIQDAGLWAGLTAILMMISQRVVDVWPAVRPATSSGARPLGDRELPERGQRPGLRHALKLLPLQEFVAQLTMTGPVLGGQAKSSSRRVSCPFC